MGTLLIERFSVDPFWRTALIIGANSRIHAAHILRLSEDLPVIISVVDSHEYIEKVLPKLDEMVQEGLITLQDVEVIKYRANAREAGETCRVHSILGQGTRDEPL